MILRRAKTMVDDNLDKVRAINRRYAHPRLAISPAVRVCLVILRLYLLFLVGLLVYRFVAIVVG